MSHEVETMAWTNEVPWHGLGKEMQEGQPIDEWVKAAGLDWKLIRSPRYYFNKETEEYVQNIDSYTWYRSDNGKVMADCGHQWKPIQPADVLRFMKDYVEAGGATIETAGSLRGGAHIWSLARLKHDFEVSPGDRVNGYLLLTSANKVGTANTIRTTTVRVVCANTMALAESQGSITYRQNHLADFDVEAARDAIGVAHEELAAAERRWKTIKKLKVSALDAAQKVLAPVFSPGALDQPEIMENILDPDVAPKQLGEIMLAMERAPGAEPGTGWGVLNGVTYWSDHMAGAANSGQTGARLFNSWLGSTSKKKEIVERKLMELAE